MIKMSQHFLKHFDKSSMKGDSQLIYARLGMFQKMHQAGTASAEQVLVWNVLEH